MSIVRLRPFEVFCLLTVGMVTQTGLCTVTGMLVGTGMQTMISHHRAHRCFSTHAWSADQREGRLFGDAREDWLLG